MSDYVQRGSATVAVQTSEQWSPSNWTIMAPVEGLRGDIDALASIYRGSGISYTITPMDGPSARLEVQYQGSVVPSEDAVSTQWKFSSKGTLVPVEEHPDFVEALNTLITGWEAVNENNVALGLRTLGEYLGGTSTDDLDAAKLADIQEPLNGLVEFTRMIMGGTKSYLRPEPVLVVTSTYQPSAAFIPDTAVVGVVYTNSQLNTALGIPAGVYAKMKSGEWLAEEVELDYQSDGTKVVTQVFRYAVVWDSKLYDHAT